VHGIAHYDANHAKPPRQAPQRAQVFAAIVAPFQREHRLRRQAQLVRDGHADAAVANVQTEIAKMRFSFQFLAPDF